MSTDTVLVYFIFAFEQILIFFLVFMMLTLNKKMHAKKPLNSNDIPGFSGHLYLINLEFDSS